MVQRAIGVDIGGTYIRAGVVDERGRVSHIVRRPTGSASPAKAFLDRIKSAIQEAAGQLPPGDRDRLAGVGIGFPGLVDTERGYSYHAGNLAGWTPTPLVEELGERVPWRIAVENDVRAGARGELTFGAARGSRVALYVSIGTGVGGALLVDGRVYEGAGGLAGEIGHFVIDAGAADYPCSCGNAGDLEALVSGPAIALRAQRYAAALPEDQEAAARAPTLRSEEVLEGASTRIAFRRCLEDVAAYTAIGLAGLANILNPDVIVLAGGVGSSPRYPLAEIAAQTRQRCLPRIADGLRIVQAELGGLSGVMGAAVVLFERRSRRG